jgi:hypothetical protein
MSRRFFWIYVGAAVLALVTARPYAGGWNDGSRLATVECLVDYGTWAIDLSTYRAPVFAGRPPYAPDSPASIHGTYDKLLIKGRFYSDKSPVPALPMAGVYRFWRLVGGPSAADRPDLFALGLTWLFAGTPYLLAVICIARVTQLVGVPPPWDVVLTATFAFGSLALPYAQHVNNHILLLAVAAAICEAAVRRGSMKIGRAVWLGMLAGFGYTIDLGAGPPLAAAVAGLVLYTGRPKWSRMLAFVLAAIPFVALHHAITYSIAGTIGPANANPDYLNWPGSPFTGRDRTGEWQHPSVPSAGLYALELLFGKKGFLLYSLPLVLAVLGAPWVNRRPFRERPAIIALSAWAVATWLLYAATSRNLSGACLSIRWFIPLLVPGYLVLAVIARDFPSWRRDIAVLASGGTVLTGELVWRGPWDGHIPKLLWPVGLTLVVWGILVAQRLRRR